MKRWIQILLILAGSLLVILPTLKSCAIMPPNRPTLAAIVYESEQTAIPDYVHSARGKIEQQGVQFRIVDEDVVDGEGKVPLEIAPSIEAAKLHGLPALTVQHGASVTKCIDLPKSSEAIVDAVLK